MRRCGLASHGRMHDSSWLRHGNHIEKRSITNNPHFGERVGGSLPEAGHLAGQRGFAVVLELALEHRTVEKMYSHQRTKPRYQPALSQKHPQINHVRAVGYRCILNPAMNEEYIVAKGAESVAPLAKRYMYNGQRSEAGVFSTPPTHTILLHE